MQAHTRISIFVFVLILALFNACGGPAAPAGEEALGAEEPVMTTSKLDTMPVANAIAYTQGWQNEVIGDTTIFGGKNIFAFKIPRSDFANLLAATDSTYDFRAYMGYKANPQPGEEEFELMLVAVNASGKDVIDSKNYVYDFTSPCPDLCDTTSLLCGGCR